MSLKNCEYTHQAQKKYIERNFIHICKKFLYYGYCMSAGVLKILSILRSWGGCKISPKTAKNSEIFATLYQALYTKQFNVSENSNNKNFLHSYYTSQKNFLFFVHTQGTFFDPQIWAVKLKKIEISANFQKIVKNS